MKKAAVIFLTVLASVSITGCNSDENNGCTPKAPVNEKSYIQGFFELNDFHAGPISGIIVNKENNTVSMMSTSFDAPKVYEISDGIGIYIAIGSEGIDKGLIGWKKEGAYSSYYYELVEKIGDVSYNSKVMHGLSYDGRIIAVADTLQSANITCNRPLDENHPAGSSLNDVFSVYFEDPCAVIKNGYQTPAGENHYSLEGIPENFPYSLFGARLSSVDLTTKPHMGTRWGLVLETVPEETGEYIFTVSITNKQGKTIEKTARPIQIKGLK